MPDEVIKKAMRLAHEAVQKIIIAQKIFIEGERKEAQLLLEKTTIAPSTDTDIVSIISKEKEAGAGAAASIEASSSMLELVATATKGADGVAVDGTAVVAAVANSSIFVVSEALEKAVEEFGLSGALDIFRKGKAYTRAQRSQQEGKFRSQVTKFLAQDPVWSMEHAVARSMAADGVMSRAFRQVVLEGGRADGRGVRELRNIVCSPDVLPVVHGSCFFQRGDTHVLCTATLGSKNDAKTFKPINGAPERADSFILHYDFPPYCTGEVGNSTSLNRRMIGHGNLAERALRPVMPSVADFPYTVRVYSECTSSNGSSSMASACGGSMALLDAGVPIKASVAGLSIGLVTSDSITSLSGGGKSMNEGKNGDLVVSLNNADGTNKIEAEYVLLTDILGTEDHYGDMDFKVAGSATGVTSIQLDVKLPEGIPLGILEEALDRARAGRLEILASMTSAISVPRSSVKDTAPRVALVRFDPDRRRFLIGPGGEMLRHIEEQYDCKIDVSDEGVAYIFGYNARGVADARVLIHDLVNIVQPGDTFSAEVVDVKDFGLMVKITRAQEALLHISELTHDPVALKKSLTELVAVGQRLDVQVCFCIIIFIIIIIYL